MWTLNLMVSHIVAHINEELVVNLCLCCIYI